jgi:hypothetical protein
MARKMTEAEFEALVDSAVMRRLGTDSAYLNAEDAVAQQQREDEITHEVVHGLMVIHGDPYEES